MNLIPFAENQTGRCSPDANRCGAPGTNCNLAEGRCPKMHITSMKGHQKQLLYRFSLADMNTDFVETLLDLGNLLPSFYPCIFRCDFEKLWAL